MRKFISDFIHRGLMASGVGPIFFAIISLILNLSGVKETMSVKEVCIGIISLTLLAFTAGGLNAVHQIDNMPLMIGILIHGAVLYVFYLITYLVNGWLGFGIIPILIFTGIFIIGYFVIWIVIYSVIKKKTENLNKILKEKQENKK